MCVVEELVIKKSVIIRRGSPKKIHVVTCRNADVHFILSGVVEHEKYIKKRSLVNWFSKACLILDQQHEFCDR